MGTHAIAAADAAAKSSSSALTFPILIVLVFVGFYFLMIRPQRRRQQQVAQQHTVSPGARVRTTAGMYATVVAVDGDDVVLEVAPGIEVRYLKRAIMEVIDPGEADEGETYEDDESEPFDDPSSFHDDAEDDETPGTHTGADDVKSAEDGLTDSHDDLAKSDKGNAH